MSKIRFQPTMREIIELRSDNKILRDRVKALEDILSSTKDPIEENKDLRSIVETQMKRTRELIQQIDDAGTLRLQHENSIRNHEKRIDDLTFKIQRLERHRDTLLDHMSSFHD